MAKYAANYGDEFSLPFQQHLLAVLARTPSLIQRYRSVVRFEFFAAADHRVVAKALLDVVDQYNVLPSEVTLLETIKDQASEEVFPKAKRVVEKLFKANLADTEAVVARLIDFGQTQAMVNAVLSSSRHIEHGDHARVRQEIDQALLVGHDLLDFGLSIHDTERLNWYTSPALQTADRIRTGVTHVDQAMQGGLGRGELGVILAPPKRGKSTTLINFGFGALCDIAKLNVVHFTLEMDKEKTLRRYDDRLMGMRVKRKRTDPEWYVNSLQDRLQKFVHGNLFCREYATRTADVHDLRANLMTLSSQGYPPDLILVDYGGIMKPARRLGEHRHEVEGIFEDLRALAKEFDAGCWSAAQANRAATEKEVVTMTDFAEAFGIAAVADAVWAFCQTPDERIDMQCRLFAAAMRDSGDGSTVLCNINRDSCLLQSIELLDESGTVQQASKVDSIAKESGIGKPARKKARKKVAKKTTGKTAARTGRKVARRKSSKPTTRVNLD